MQPQYMGYTPPMFFETTTQAPLKIETVTELSNKTIIPTDPEQTGLKNDFGMVLFEKYRPQDFNSILGQKEIVDSVKNHLRNLPHMILKGTPGTGKTTLVNVIAKELGAELLVLNSSDDRGINTIRKDSKIPKSGRVMDFIRHSDFTGRLKIVFFDEADGMTPEAQDCLKAIIEKYSFKVRFIFACNNIGKIIDPIKSRCKEYQFKKIDAADMLLRLQYINEQEHLGVNKEYLQRITLEADGDLRKAINLLQGGC